jgi:hypothetical protein
LLSLKGLGSDLRRNTLWPGWNGGLDAKEFLELIVLVQRKGTVAVIDDSRRLRRFD